MDGFSATVELLVANSPGVSIAVRAGDEFSKISPISCTWRINSQRIQA